MSRRPAGPQTCTAVADTGEKQGEGEAGVKHRWWRCDTGWSNRQMDGKKRKEKKTQQQTFPLPEHLGERGVAVIWPGGRRGAGQGRAGRDGERKGLTHTEGKTGLLERTWLETRLSSKQVEKRDQTMKFVQPWSPGQFFCLDTHWTHRIAWPLQMIKLMFTVGTRTMTFIKSFNNKTANEASLQLTAAAVLIWCLARSIRLSFPLDIEYFCSDLN